MEILRFNTALIGLEITEVADENGVYCDFVIIVMRSTQREKWRKKRIWEKENILSQVPTFMSLAAVLFLQTLIYILNSWAGVERQIHQC